jgi:hypothetical protein
VVLTIRVGGTCTCTCETACCNYDPDEHDYDLIMTWPSGPLCDSCDSVLTGTFTLSGAVPGSGVCGWSYGQDFSCTCPSQVDATLCCSVPWAYPAHWKANLALVRDSDTKLCYWLATIFLTKDGVNQCTSDPAHLCHSVNGDFEARDSATITYQSATFSAGASCDSATLSLVSHSGHPCGQNVCSSRPTTPSAQDCPTGRRGSAPRRSSSSGC